MENFGYIFPIGVLILISILKLTINEKFSFESVKRLFVETSVDVVSLGISFIITYIGNVSDQIMVIEKVQESSENMVYGFKILFLYIVILVITIFTSKFFVQRYDETEKIFFIISGVIISYAFAVPCMVYAIVLLMN